MIKKLLKRIGYKLGYELRRLPEHSVTRNLPFDFDLQTIDTYEKVKTFTMTSPERIASLCNAVKYLVDNNIQGAIVECGVWRGGSTMAAIDTLLKVGDITRSIYLYDTFEGMSEPTEHDKQFSGDSASDLLNGSDKEESTSVWCYSALEEVQHNISTLNYPSKLIHYVKGKIENTIPKTMPDSIALLRLDTDWYKSTSHELNHLYPLLMPQGVIIIDDYGHWDGVRKAVDEYIETQKLPLLLNRIDYTGRIGVKC